MPLDDIRKTIDSIDTQLLDLLSQRADAVHEVGEIKKKEGLQITPPNVKTPSSSLLSKKIKDASPKNRSAQFTAKSCPPLSPWKTT